jgi:uncharacterized protein YeaO (DUF488 family)
VEGLQNLGRGTRRVLINATILGEWREGLAPCTALRTWFGHDPAKCAGFREGYRKEWDESGVDALKELVERFCHETIMLGMAQPMSNTIRR